MAVVPFYHIILTILDVAAIMIFFKFIRLILRISIGLPRALSPGVWIDYIKTHGYSFVKDLPVVKKVAKEQAKLEKDLDAELKARSRGIIMVRDHERMRKPDARHVPGADMPSPSAKKKTQNTDTDDIKRENGA